MTKPYAAEVAEVIRRSSMAGEHAKRLADKIESTAAEIFMIREVVERLHAIKDVRSLFAIATILVEAELLAILGNQQIGQLRAAVRDNFRDQNSAALMRIIMRHLPNVPQAWIDYGTMHGWQGKNWKARRSFLQGLRMSGNKAIILPKLAGACRRLSRLDEAATWLAKAEGEDELAAVRAEQECIDVFRAFANTEFPNSWEVFKANKQIDSPAAVVNVLREAVSARRPLSLIRLGDGEGNLIAYFRDKSNETLSEYCRAIVRIMFGNSISDFRVFADAVQDDFEIAIRNADILGVLLKPVSDQIQRHGVDRQTAGNLANARELVCGNLRPTLLCTSEVHHSTEVLDFVKECFRTQPVIGMITCRPEVAKTVSERYACNVRLYEIPGEAKAVDLSSISEPHFPNVFEKVRVSIRVEYPGQVFLVGAGLLGKIYCDVVKSKGGIAIDIGSVFDAWAGKMTRAGFRNMNSHRFSEFFSL